MGWFDPPAKDGDKSDKSIGDHIKDAATVAVTTAAIAAGVYGTAVEPQSTSNLSDQAGHYNSSQVESKTSEEIQAAVNDKGNDTTSTSGKP